MLKTGENFANYKIRSAIGTGGMGEIYLARDTKLRRDVAIKILPENLLRDDSTIERFKREAYAASALNHPNILTIFDIGEFETIHFIVTEFVEGKTLRQKIAESQLSLAEILDIAVQTANALIAAHDAGIVHRDVKPENIMIRGDGYVKVLDFGIAKLSEPNAPNIEAELEISVQAVTNKGIILGTPLYMSPEQARGLTVDARSDVFSLGVVIYELIAGRLPFSGATVSDIIASILRSEPTPLSEIVKNIPFEIERIIIKSLTKSADERFQTMKDFLIELRQAGQRLNFETGLQRLHNSNEYSFTDQPTQILSKTSIKPPRKTRKAIDSLAILPLVNDKNNLEIEYLADGITENIINSLSNLPKIRVVPRSTVFRYKGSITDVQEIGCELGVRAVFAGRIVRVGKFLVINVELIDICNQAQIWGEQYRRETTDIFALLEEIAENISEKLRLKLSGEDKKRIAKRYTDNAEAYQFYLKGRYFVTSKRTEEWIKKGIGYFQKAINLDPNYALAYTGISEAYGFLASSTGGWSPRKAYPRAKAAAMKALELDDALGEAHCSLGFSHLLYDWNFDEAEEHFKRAVELSPHYANAYDGYGFFLKAVGRHKEAIEKCKIVQKLDPLSPFAHVSLGYSYYFARDFKKAIGECRKALEMDRNSTFAHRNLGLAYLQQGKYDEAIAALTNAVNFSQESPAFESYLGFAYAVAGKRDEALRILASLNNCDKKRYVAAYNFALVYTGLGEFDEAFKWLKKACQERSGFLPFLKVEPVVDRLRNDSRFEKILVSVGLV